MSREKIKSKYGMSMQQPAAGIELTSWKDSPAVVKLSEFIQANRHHGIHIITKNGRPVLSFNPGLNRGSRERWDAALKAEILYIEAIDDLMQLIRNYKITLPEGHHEQHGLCLQMEEQRKAPDPVQPPPPDPRKDEDEQCGSLF